MTKRVLVTGGATGIGGAIVEQLAAAGYAVELTFHQSADAARQLAARLPASAQARAHAVDLSSPEAVTRFTQQIAEVGYYGWVHCAGATSDALAAMHDRGRSLAAMEINYWSALELMRAVLPAMRRAHAGRIVLIGSVAAQRGSQGNGHYAATKAALAGYMRCVVPEVARRGITVNCVAPGFIDTRLIAGLQSRAPAILRAIPARRYGQPAEVASAVRYLLSEDAGYINGATLTVDGGLSASLAFSE